MTIATVLMELIVTSGTMTIKQLINYVGIKGCPTIHPIPAS